MYEAQLIVGNLANISVMIKCTGIAGMVEPIRGGVEAGLRLGVGKAEQESFFICADNVTRKRLEAEVQAEEDYERTLARQVLPLQ